MKSLAAGSLVVLLFFAVPPAARACSCAAPESNIEAARSALRGSDLAFIGVLKSVKRIGQPPPPGTAAPPGNGFYRYRVLRAYGGDPGKFVRVRSSLDEASCGLPRSKGRKFAIAANRSRRDRVLESDLCSLLKPRALRRAANEADRSGGANSDC